MALVREVDLRSTSALVTGANTGIGRVTALSLAELGAHVWLACRSEDRTRPVLDAIVQHGGKASFVPLDLGDLDSVRACAQTVAARLDAPLRVLVNNAGLAGTGGLTKSGFELAFGTNHIGHFALTMQLVTSLQKGATAELPARIVNVSSNAHYRAKRIDFDAVRRPTATRTGLSEYQTSKLANVLFTAEIARRLGRGRVHSYALHPGVVASDLWRPLPKLAQSIARMFMISNEQGAKTSLYCATSTDLVNVSGKYYDESRERTPSRLARDEDLARALWDKSVTWTGTNLP